MWNIMRAQTYQLIRKKVIYFLAIAFLVFAGVLIFVLYLSDEMTLPTGSQFFAESGINIVMYSVMFFMVGIVSQVMCSDFEDKTICYEILSGHSRAQVYLGRAVVAILMASIGNLLLFLVYPVLLTLYKGWGITMNIEHAVICCVLLLVVFIRISSEFVLVSIVIRSTNLSYLVGFMLSFIQMFVVFLYEGTNHFITGLSNCGSILGFGYSAEGMTEAQDFVNYEAVFTAELVGGTIGVSLFVSIFCLWLGYLHFKKKDIG